jgi:hypothetical protein
VAGRSHQQYEKRLRERAKQEKADAKRARRSEKRDEDAEGEAGPTEDELLEAVRVLNEQHAAGEIDTETFEEQRAELFEQLGIG